MGGRSSGRIFSVIVAGPEGEGAAGLSVHGRRSRPARPSRPSLTSPEGRIILVDDGRRGFQVDSGRVTSTPEKKQFFILGPSLFT